MTTFWLIVAAWWAFLAFMAWALCRARATPLPPHRERQP